MVAESKEQINIKSDGGSYSGEKDAIWKIPLNHNGGPVLWGVLENM